MAQVRLSDTEVVDRDLQASRHVSREEAREPVVVLDDRILRQLEHKTVQVGESLEDVVDYGQLKEVRAEVHAEVGALRTELEEAKRLPQAGDLELCLEADAMRE